MSKSAEIALYEALSGFTSFDVIFGGNSLVANFDRGAVILTPITQKPITRSVREWQNVTLNEGEDTKGVEIPTINQFSLIATTYQCDVYRVNPSNIDYISANREATLIQEFLKSMEVSEKLAEAQSEILPSFTNISFLTDFNEQKKLVNRAFFEFVIISQISVKESINIVKNAKINNEIINSN